ncbi:MAG: prepilin-type N-terminal cleavage/methylation domain-containing protein [Acidobacteria bacterium]|nr:prepilin-type N-terminal cleavage/methylation domain-containing protein [Acidobacteriota bacterium]
MKGFTIIELIIGLAIAAVAVVVVTVSIGPGIANLQPDRVIIQIASNLSEAKRAALRGSLDIKKRTFDLREDLKISTQGVVVTTEPIESSSQCSSNCSSDELLMCVSGQPFCFTPSNTFTFERFSGKAPESHAIFVISSKRKLAILINESGDYAIVEMIQGQWRSRTDLQNLTAPNQSTKKNEEITPNK